MHDDTLTSIFNDNPASFAIDPQLQLPARLKYWAGIKPECLFLTEVGGREITYAGFYQEIQRWCQYLRSLSLESGDRIANLLPVSIDSYALWISAALLGVVEVSVNRDLRGEFLRHPIRNVACKFIFVRPEDGSLLPDNGVENVSVVKVPRDGSFVAGYDEYVVEQLPGYADVACVIYTSGSTGPAKGAVIRWAQLSSIIGRLPREWLSEKDVIYSPWPMFHITGRTPVISMADVGGRVVIREKFSLREFWRDIRCYHCTGATVGAAVPQLLNLPAENDDQDNPLITAYGNASGSFNLAFQQRFGVRMLLCYGSTEAGFPVVNRNIPETGTDIAGYFRPGYQAKLIDEKGREVKPGQPGELLIKPDVPEMIMAGYLNMPDKTREVLRDGWYHTGDKLYFKDDGGLVFVDRMKDTIRRKGENISSVAYEGDLLKLDDVLECAVLSIDSKVNGKEIILVVRHRSGIDTDPGGFYKSLIPLYPKYMLPSYVLFVDGYPKTPGGKIQKHIVLKKLSLKECWQSPVADAS